MKIIQLTVSPDQATQEDSLRSEIVRRYKIRSKFNFRIVKRSIDARRRPVKINLQIELYKDNEKVVEEVKEIDYRNVNDSNSVIVVGFGPAGMFASLELIKLGLKPVIIERGKDIRSRRRDLALISKKQIINPESNYCFGEGGAGTFSDGKLYTRSKKRGDIKEILSSLIQHGAPKDILIDAHPHIGTNKLPKVVSSIKQKILDYGGEIHFNTKLTDVIIENDRIKGIQTECGKTFLSNSVILATGHSSREIYHLLSKRDVTMEGKPFALGVRVEHPQELINRIQYHGDNFDECLPPASYQLVKQVHGRGVFSFCMCPGGIIAPCATAPGEIVTNGWSPSKRNNPYANSGIVVTIEKEDLQAYQEHGIFAGLELQKELERKCFEVANIDSKDGLGQKAPAQRLLDFIEGVGSKDLPKCSYSPGIISAPLHEVLPKSIVTRLQEGFVHFGKKMKGYLVKDAVIVAVESRTSSPLKILRDETMQHPKLHGLYPCGEGAGYAGGIISAAIDGQKCARAVFNNDY